MTILFPRQLQYVVSTNLFHFWTSLLILANRLAVRKIQRCPHQPLTPKHKIAAHSPKRFIQHNCFLAPQCPKIRCIGTAHRRSRTFQKRTINPQQRFRNGIPFINNNALGCLIQTVMPDIRCRGCSNVFTISPLL